MRTHYGPWQPCWISNQHQKHKSGRGPSSEHFWQVWLISVQRFQRRRFKCEKLTDGRTLTHDKSSHGLWPGELKSEAKNKQTIYQNLKNNKQKSENKIQKYTKPEKITMFLLTQVTLIKNEFMTLILVCRGGSKGGGGGGGCTRRGKNMIFYTRNTPNIFAPPSVRRNFFKCTPPPPP